MFNSELTDLDAYCSDVSPEQQSGICKSETENKSDGENDILKDKVERQFLSKSTKSEFEGNANDSDNVENKTSVTDQISDEGSHVNYRPAGQSYTQESDNKHADLKAGLYVETCDQEEKIHDDNWEGDKVLPNNDIPPHNILGDTDSVENVIKTKSEYTVPSKTVESSESENNKVNKVSEEDTHKFLNDSVRESESTDVKHGHTSFMCTVTDINSDDESGLTKNISRSALSSSGQNDSELSETVDSELCNAKGGGCHNSEKFSELDSTNTVVGVACAIDGNNGDINIDKESSENEAANVNTSLHQHSLTEQNSGENIPEVVEDTFVHKVVESSDFVENTADYENADFGDFIESNLEQSEDSFEDFDSSVNRIGTDNDLTTLGDTDNASSECKNDNKICDNWAAFSNSAEDSKEAAMDEDDWAAFSEPSSKSKLTSEAESVDAVDDDDWGDFGEDDNSGVAGVRPTDSETKVAEKLSVTEVQTMVCIIVSVKSCF